MRVVKPIICVRSLTWCESGVAAVEAALLFPVLLLLFLGGFEVARYILVTQKVEKVAFALTDVVSQYEQVGPSEFGVAFSATAELMKPYSFGSDGVVILTSVAKDANNSKQTVRWQCSGGGTAAKASKIGKVGNEAKLPDNMKLEDGDNVIVGEVFYKYEPLISSYSYGTSDVYRRSMFRPRLGTLMTASGC